MSRIKELYDLIKPVSDMIEKNKGEFDRLVNEIEQDDDVNDGEYSVIFELSSSMLDLSRNGGHTSMKLFDNMVK